MTNDNKKPTFEDALYNMISEMGFAQSRIYQAQGVNQEAAYQAQLEVDRLRRLHEPKIMNTIVRKS